MAEGQCETQEEALEEVSCRQLNFVNFCAIVLQVTWLKSAKRPGYFLCILECKTRPQ